MENLNNNLYKIISKVYDDNGAIYTTSSSTYEIFNAVFEPDGTGKGRLRVNVSGGTGGASELDDLTDVTITGVVNGQLLGYNGSGWVNVNPGAASAFPLKDLTDATIISEQVDQIIKWDGTAWVNVDIDSLLTNYYTSSEVDANFLSANTSYYTQSEADANFLSASTETVSETWVTNNFLSADTSYYTQSEADANFLSANTSYYTQTEANNNFLSANTSYYTQQEVNDNFLSGDTFIPNELSELDDVNVNASPTDGASLVWSNSQSKWIDNFLSYSINGLTDTSVSSPNNNDVLIWNSTTSKWENGANANTTTLVDLTDTSISSPTTNQALVYNGSVWVNADQIDTKTLEALTDTNISSPASNQWLKYDGSNWINTKIQLSDIENVNTTAPTSGQVLTYNGSSWVNQDATTGSSSLVDLTDTSISSPSNGQSLVYNGSVWVNSNVTPDMSNYYTSGETDANFLSANTSLSGLSDVTISSVGNSQILTYNSATTQWENIDTAIINTVNPQSGDTLVYNSGEWTNSAISYYTQAECDANFLSADTSLVTSLSALTDVDLSSVTSGDALMYDGSNWVNQAITTTNVYTADGSLTDDRTLTLTGYSFEIAGTGMTTTYEDDSVLTVITDDGTSVTGTTNVENWSVGVQDDSTYDLSYIEVNLSSGITISSNNSGSTSSGDTSYIKISSTGFDTTMILDELNNVSISSATSNDMLLFDGSNWSNIASADNFLSANTNLNGLSDVNISGVTSGDTIIYQSGEWFSSAVTMSANEFAIGDSINESKIILTASDGTQYYLTVDSSGNLVTTAV